MRAPLKTITDYRLAIAVALHGIFVVRGRGGSIGSSTWQLLRYDARCVPGDLSY